MVKTATICTAVCVTALTMVSCSVSTPLTPTPAKNVTTSSSAPDASSLKVSAPTLISPADGATLASTRPTFSVSTVNGQFSNNLPGLAYEFEIQNDAGNKIDGTFRTDTTWDTQVPLNGDTPFRWRARATLGDSTGPWSTVNRFRTPAEVVLTCPNKSDKKSVSDWFFQLASSVSVSTNTVANRAKMIPGFDKCSVAWQNQRRGDTRARFFLPPLQNPNGDSDFVVDTGTENGPFQLFFRY